MYHKHELIYTINLTNFEMKSKNLIEYSNMKICIDEIILYETSSTRSKHNNFIKSLKNN